MLRAQLQDLAALLFICASALAMTWLSILLAFHVAGLDR